jgi:hypothetical protein
MYGESGSGKGFRHRWADKRLQRPPLTWRSTERFRGAAELRAVSPTNRGISENSLMDALAATGLLRTGWTAGVA